MKRMSEYSIEMESQMKLLSEIELGKIPIEKKWDEKDKPESSFVFSSHFWGDPSIRKKEQLVAAYKLKNWNHLADILKNEFTVNVSAEDHWDDKIKEIFWETLLSRPMESEVLEMIENSASMCINLHLCASYCNDAYQSASMCISLHRCTLIFPDVYQSGIDVHQSGIDVHQSGIDVHQSGIDVHQSGIDAHQSGIDDLFFLNNEMEFNHLINTSLNQEFFSNFQQIMSTNRILSRKCAGLVINSIESHIFCKLRIKSFEQFTITKADNFFEINVLKYIIYYDKLEVERQKMLINRFLALEPRQMFRYIFEILLAILSDNSEVFTEKFENYLRHMRSLYPTKEMESIVTGDSNLIVVKAFASELENVIQSVIKKPLIDINRLMIPHRFFKYDVPLTFYIAERGYNELLTAAFESKKNIKTLFKDSLGTEVTLLTFCIRGFKYNKRLSIRSDISTDFDDCIDILLKNLSDDKIFHKTTNPMLEAIKYNQDNAAIKLIQKFGLMFEFVQVMNTRVLNKYLDIHVNNNHVGIAVNYQFLKDQTIKNIVRKYDLKTSIQHPVIANYVELKYSQFWPLHVTDLFLFIVFCISCPTFYCFFRHKSSNYDYLLYLAILYTFLRFCLQLALFYYCLLVPNLLNGSCKNPTREVQNPLRRSRILAGTTEVLNLFLLMATLFSHLFTNRPEYLFSGSLLLMTIEMTKMLSRISPASVSQYILMFKTVAFTLFITMTIFFWIIVAFTLAFHVVVYMDKSEEISKLNNFWTSFTTTMTIFMGGHDGEALKFKGWWNLMLFVLFVLIAISVYNLAIDLAMENAKQLRDNGDFVSLEKQFNAILEYGEFFKIGSEPVSKIIYTRRPDETTIIEELIWRVNSSILRRLKTFDRKNQWHSQTVQITQSRYNAMNLIIKSNEERLIRTDNDVRIDEIEKTVHQIEDLNLRMEHKINVVRRDNDKRKDQLNQMKLTMNQLESRFDSEAKERNLQLNKILMKLEHLDRRMNEIFSDSSKKLIDCKLQKRNANAI
ncbi:Transient receptor potential cation channel protein painless [Pseudolycoriella hygida]|uniref:Transient receptor potential cation channel protein painless n=1 Tax=Pseudolycoriella hygida TaxID=35572 RepID=A0A9Q0S5D1_9DIPT|nr:Transient receptor potential cation channel protein painless [Pseudolycoriella hygida]